VEIRLAGKRNRSGADGAPRVRRAPGLGREALIVITPGIERFDYFRHVARIRGGTERRGTLLVLHRFDTHFVDSAAWHGARAAE
jgi:hypothetical protein